MLSEEVRKYIKCVHCCLKTGFRKNTHIMAKSTFYSEKHRRKKQVKGVTLNPTMAIQ